MGAGGAWPPRRACAGARARRGAEGGAGEAPQQRLSVPVRVRLGVGPREGRERHPRRQASSAAAVPRRPGVGRGGRLRAARVQLVARAETAGGVVPVRPEQPRVGGLAAAAPAIGRCRVLSGAVRRVMAVAPGTLPLASAMRTSHLRVVASVPTSGESKPSCRWRALRAGRRQDRPAALPCAPAGRTPSRDDGAPVTAQSSRPARSRTPQ